MFYKYLEVKHMSEIKVTIGIPVYNSEQYINTCIDSILAQTMPQENIEIIAVNDGSTDNSGAILEEYAKRISNMIVIHQENSGGPGLPRNKVIDMARGEYIFFVDIDDYLGPEAVERMYNMGVANETDIILGKFVGVNGRDVAKSMFQFNQPNTNVYDSTLVNALGPTKMFKKTFLYDQNIRFPIGVLTAEDQPFMLKAYILAKGISIVADYPCYYTVMHSERDHASITKVDPKTFYQTIQNGIDVIHTYSPNKEKGDILLVKYLKREFNVSRSKLFVFDEMSIEEKLDWLKELNAFVKKNIPEEIEKQLSDKIRAQIYFIKEMNFTGLENFLLNETNLLGKVIEGKVIINEPANLNLPIDYRDFTKDNKAPYKILSISWTGQKIRLEGYIYSTYVKSNLQTVNAILVNRNTKEEAAFPISTFSLSENQLKEYQIPEHAKENSGFVFEFDFKDCLSILSELGPLDLFFEVQNGEYVKRVRIGKNRLDTVTNKFLTSFAYIGEALLPVTPYYTKDYKNLSFDIGATVKSFVGVELEDSYWDEQNNYYFKVRLSVNTHSTILPSMLEMKLFIKERDRDISFTTNLSYKQINQNEFEVEKTLYLLNPIDDYKLFPGNWYFSIIFNYGDYSKTIRFGTIKKQEARKIEKQIQYEMQGKGYLAKGFFTKPYGNLSLEIIEQ